MLYFYWTLIRHLRRNFFPMALQPPVDQDLLVIETSRSQSDTPKSEDEWWDRRGDLYVTTHNNHKRQTSMPPAGSEPAIPSSERSQTHAVGIRWKEEYPEEMDSCFRVAYVYNCTCLLSLKCCFFSVNKSLLRPG